MKLSNNYLIVNVGFGQNEVKLDCGLLVVALPLRGKCDRQCGECNLQHLDKNRSCGKSLPFFFVSFCFSLFLAAALEPNAGFAYNGARFIYYRPEP